MREGSQQTWSIEEKYFRFILLKYPERGLADDRFWFNGQMRLYETLFWITNAVFFSLPYIANLARLTGDDLYFENSVG